jgi:HD-like signal output (HDOD) protein
MNDNEALVFDQVIGWIKSGELRLQAYSPATLKMLGRSNFDEDIVGLERMIMDDQALAVEVLRMANSPFYYAVSHVTTVRNAIVRLGIPTVKRIVILVLERSRYKSWFSDLNTLLIKLWTHVSMTAMSAQWLSHRLRLSGIEEICFLGGLLHDIGRLAIICAIDEMRKTRNIKQNLPVDALQELIADYHCPIGYEIMNRWEIPDIYCQIARDHRGQEFDADNLPLVVVRLANKCSLLMEEDNSAPWLLETPETQILNINETTLLELQKILGRHKAATA